MANSISTVRDLLAALEIDTVTELAAMSEVFDHEGLFGADVTAFVTPIPGGLWAAWTDVEGSSGHVSVLGSRAAAFSDHRLGLEAIRFAD